MFRPRIGQQLLIGLALGLGLVLLPALSWASTVVIPAPFDSFATYTGPGGQVPSLSVYGSVSIANDGGAAPTTIYYSTYNTSNNDMVFVPAVQDEAHALALYNAVNDMVRSGADGGDWAGKGITSSFAALDASNGNGAMGVGVILNDASIIGDPGNALWGTTGDFTSTWDGYNPTAFDTLVKYTFLGDTFLRGMIDTFDTSAVQDNSDLALVPTTNTWANGDFYYQSTSGVPINTFDTSAVFNGQVLQADYPLTVNAGASLGGVAVPEPNSAFLALLGMAIAAIGGMAIRSKKAAHVVTD